jgi:predicted lipid-binding transport protein (Tim44 family)
LRHPNAGQETFAIYGGAIIHGAITGYSLRSFAKLTALEAVLGALIFLAFFIALVQVLEPIRHFFRNFRTFFISNGKPSKPQ